MKKIFILLAFLLPAAAWAQTVEKPTAEGPLSFAVITDAETFRRARPAIYEYRDALQRDGLATYIVYDDWKNPDQVRDRIRRLLKKDRTLEGILLLGDIPVVRVRNAQHMTTAFKMDEQKFPKDESSVASDRFYDDLNLRFEFIERDGDDFYYNLTADSPQSLDPTIYSGRVRYPELMGGDRYQAISAFLRKAVAERERAGRLETLVTYAGDHYNSDDLTVWIDEKIALNEHFPLTDRDNNSSRQLNFRMDDYMKFRLFDQMQRPDVDLFLFNEHGLVEKQQISPDIPVNSAEKRMDALKASVYATIAREERKPNGDPEGAREYFQKTYTLGDGFFDDYSREGVEDDAALRRRNTVIDLEDLAAFDQQPRVVVLHACYNGSFHRPASVASYYIFNPGRTVAVQGNTVNVLQDKWAYELIGLLSHGVRVGQWNRLVPTLEGHIIGDPTFRFRPVEPNTLAVDMTARRGDTAFWRESLSSPHADVVALSLRMLADAGAITSSELLQTMKESPMATVRMECLKLLSRFGNADFTEAVRLGLHDRYEMVRRQSAMYLPRIGDPGLIPTAADVYVNNAESQRVNYILQQGFAMFPAEDVVPVLSAAVRASGWPGSEELEQSVTESVRKTQERKERDLAAIMDRDAPEDVRIAAIRSIRNNNYHEFVPDYLAFVADGSQPGNLRVMMAEALGWFTLSHERETILSACDKMLKERGLPSALRAELRQTVNRLK